MQAIFSWLPVQNKSVVLNLTTLVLCCGLGACRAQQTPPPTAAIPVKVVALKTGQLAETSDFNASLQSRKSIQLRPQAEGRIAQIYVRSGQVVSVGTPLIQIDPAEQSAAVESNLMTIQAAQAEITNAQDTLRSLEATRKSNLATLDYNRWQSQRYTALAKEGAVSEDNAKSFTKQFLTAQADVAETDARIRAQRSTIAQRQKELLKAQADTRQQAVKLQYYRVIAPFTGTVGDIPPKVGDYVTTDTNLLFLTQSQPLEVYIRVPIERAAALSVGTTVELLDATGKIVGNSRISFISPRADDNTQTVLVKALFENRNNQLRADQQIQARIIWNRRPGVLVPTSAVSNLAGQNFVFVAEPKEKTASQLVARQKPVELGRIEGNSYQVLKGLQPGQQVIISGVQKLQDGAPINPES